MKSDFRMMLVLAYQMYVDGKSVAAIRGHLARSMCEMREAAFVSRRQATDLAEECLQLLLGDPVFYAHELIPGYVGNFPDGKMIYLAAHAR